MGGMGGKRWVGGGVEVGREVDKPPYRPFALALTTWGRWKSPTYVPYQGDIHGAVEQVPGDGPPTGALQRYHSLNCDITGLAKSPPKTSHYTECSYHPVQYN